MKPLVILSSVRIYGIASIVAFLVGLFLYIRPVVLRRVEFGHNDIVFNYAPFRDWFAGSLRNGTFPLWDPFSGLGRFAEMWTTLPVDVLTMVEFLVPLQFPVLFGIQIAVIGVITVAAVRALAFSSSQATLATVIFFLSPATAYFLRYYVHGWVFLYFAAAWCLIYAYFTERRAIYLAGLVASGAVFSIGGKMELLFYAVSVLMVACIGYAALEKEVRHNPRDLLAVFLALAGPLLLNSWYFNLIMLSAQSSIRVAEGSLNAVDFSRSAGELLKDYAFWGLIAVTVLVMDRPKIDLGGRSATFPAAAAAVCGLALACWGRSGFATGIAGGFCLWVWLCRPDMRSLLHGASKAVLLAIYFVRPIPGDVDEMGILRGLPNWMQALLAFPASFGFLHARLSKLALYCLITIGAVLFFRSVGLVAMNHLFGAVWLPARDNFLIELPLAVFATLGIAELKRRLSATWPRTDSPAAALVASVLAIGLFGKALLSHPYHMANSAQKAVPAGLWSEKLRTEALAWSDELPFTQPARKRLLSYFHGFNHPANIGDVREYQSLLSRRYALYSISQRLGVPRESLGGVGGTTAALSPHFTALLRPAPTPPAGLSDLYFWAYFLIHSVPALNCDQFRLLGVEFMETERDRYYLGNAAHLNRFYASGADREREDLADEVRRKISNCVAGTVRAGDREFWRMIKPLPPAFVAEGMTLDELRSLQISRLRVTDETIEEVDGRAWKWSPAGVRRYGVNEIVLEKRNEAGGMLFLTDLFHPAWSASVDSAQRPVEPAFEFLRALEIGTGRHEIRFWLPYPRLPAVILSCLLGLIFIVSALLLAHSPKGRGPQRAPTPAT